MAGTARCGSSRRSPSGPRRWRSTARRWPPDDPAFDDLGVLETTPWGLWCATDDPYTDASVALAEQAPVAPDPWVQGTGGHTWVYWNDQTLDMLGWITGVFEA